MAVQEHPEAAARGDSEWPTPSGAQAVWVGALVRYWFRRQDRGPMIGVTQEAVRWDEVGLFILMAFGLSWGAWIGLRPIFPELAIRTFTAMFGPTFAAIFVIRLRRGWRPRMVPRLTFRSGALASVLGAATLGGLVLIGLWLSLFSGDLTPGIGSGQDLFQVMPWSVALLIYGITAFGEEYGWRGFLLPVLSPLGGARASLVVSVIFATWHLPAILIDGFNYPRHHVLGAMAMYVFAVPFSIVMCWLRSATRSVVAPAAGHATLNILTGVIYASTVRTTSLVASPVGLLGALPLAIFSLVLLLSGRMWRMTRVVEGAPDPAGGPGPADNL